MFDRCQTIDKLEALTGVSWSSCQRILTEELHVKGIAVKWKINWKLIQTFCPESSQEMNHGVTIFFCFQEWRGTLKESVFRM